MDKGEFRWEFLVPWVNRTLTATDKFIVCSTFIGASFVAQTLFDPGASVGATHPPLSLPPRPSHPPPHSTPRVTSISQGVRS